MTEFDFKYKTTPVRDVQISEKGTYFVGYSDKEQCFKIFKTATAESFCLPCSKHHQVAGLTEKYFVFYHKHNKNLHVHVMDIKNQTTSYIEYDDVNHDCSVKIHNKIFLSIVRENITEIFSLEDLRLLKRIHLRKDCHYAHEFKHDLHYQGPLISPDNSYIVYYTQTGLILFNGEFTHFPIHKVEQVFFVSNSKLLMHCANSILTLNLKNGKLSKNKNLYRNCSLRMSHSKNYALSVCNKTGSWINIKTFKPVAKSNILNVVSFNDDIVITKELDRVNIYDCETEDLKQEIKMDSIKNVCTDSSHTLIITNNKSTGVWVKE